MAGKRTALTLFLLGGAPWLACKTAKPEVQGTPGLKKTVVSLKLWTDNAISPATSSITDQAGPFQAAQTNYVHLLVGFGSTRLPQDLALKCSIRREGGPNRMAQASRIVTQDGEYVLVTAGRDDLGGWKAGTWRLGCDELGERQFELR